MESESAASSNVPPEKLVSEIMKEGFQSMAIQTGVGIGVGFLAGLVLTRGGGGPARKVVTGFCGGAGLGSAWTRCSIQLEKALQNKEKN